MPGQAGVEKETRIAIPEAMPADAAGALSPGDPLRSDRNFGGSQFTGSRSDQEDHFAFAQVRGVSGGALLMVLADGMGGYAGGAVASRLAVQTFIDNFDKIEGDLLDRFDEALERANEAIRDEANRDARIRDMGCTLVAALLEEGALHWVSVGDSPMFLCREGRLTRLNADHSMLPELQLALERGDISQAEFDNHPERNALRSALIGQAISLVDFSDEPVLLQRGDRLIIASDGLLSLTEAEIADCTKAHLDDHARTLSRRLIDAVATKARRNQDNTTVLVALVDNPDDARPGLLPLVRRVWRSVRVGFRSVHPGLRVGFALAVAFFVGVMVFTFSDRDPVDIVPPGIEFPVRGDDSEGRP